MKSFDDNNEKMKGGLIQNNYLEHDWLQDYPAELVAALCSRARTEKIPLYITGGAVRDWLTGAKSNDLDITVPKGGMHFAAKIAEKLQVKRIPLDADEDVGRIVWRGVTVDFSSFREGTATIEADLARRDFTINALGVAIDYDNKRLAEPRRIIDPTGGLLDLQNGQIRHCHAKAFDRDPLRLLRAYRFGATLGFSLTPETSRLLHRKGAMINNCSAERIRYELELIMTAAAPHDQLQLMAEHNILQQIFPEFSKAQGLSQPASHHLDVFAHSLETLRQMIRLQRKPRSFFAKDTPIDLRQYLAGSKRKKWLRWAALFHDLGKPETHKRREGRITFYNHDQAGSRTFETIAARLRFSNEDSREISRLIANHMWPFHLNNVMRKNGDVSIKACLRLTKVLGAEFPALFILAMADSLAGEGPEKPKETEEGIAGLFQRICEVYQDSIKPVVEAPRLITGKELIEFFHLAPGPLFGELLDAVELAAAEGKVTNPDQAMEYVKRLLKTKSTLESNAS